MAPDTPRNRRRDQTARLPGRWRKLRYEGPRTRPEDHDDHTQHIDDTHTHTEEP